jgi:hypothetical protein
VDDRIDALEGSFEARSIPNITDEIPHGRKALAAEFLSHLVLFELIPAKNDKPMNLGKPFQDFSREGVTKAASSSGNKNRLHAIFAS